jgi:flavin reductase (DIM6/NTAB) family NADH-FMN oxidoreductase RutF
MKTTNDLFQWLPCPVVFICTAHENQRDIMTASAMFVSEKEPLLTVSVGEKHLTNRLISASGRFVVAIASINQKKLAIQLGSTKGEKSDKYTRFSIPTLPKNAGDGLVPTGVSAWMKCSVKTSETIKNYRVITGRVVQSGNLAKPPLVWHRDALWQLSGHK